MALKEDIIDAINNLCFKSTHDLNFEIASWPNSFNREGWLKFRVGTMRGVYLFNMVRPHIEILVLLNDDPHNGHFQDVFDWFYVSCIINGKSLVIREVYNQRLAFHLLVKKGFVRMQETMDYFKPLSAIAKDFQSKWDNGIYSK